MGKSSSKLTTTPKNPLLIPEILCHVFEELKNSPQDLKNCHLVCKTWNSVGQQYFKLKLPIQHNTEEGRKKLVKKFASTFSLSQNVECINCYSNRYEIQVFDPQTEVDINNQVVKNSDQQSNENLCFTGINLMLFDWPNKLFGCYDMSPIIYRNITQLTVIGLYNSYYTQPLFTPLAISVDVICDSILALKILHLSYCQLRTTKNTPRISLKDIELNLVQLHKDGNKVELVNEIFDFAHTTKISLNNQDAKWFLKVDMNDLCLEQLSSVNLFNIIPLNWKTSKWNVKKLIAEDIQVFREPENVDICQMKIKELDFINCEKIHHSFIPPTVQKLRIALKFASERCWIESNPNDSQHLENLKHLCLNGLFHFIEHDDSDSQLNIFSNCPELSDIHFGNNLFYIGEQILSNTLNSILIQPHKYKDMCQYNVGWEQVLAIQESNSCFAPYQINYLNTIRIGPNISKRIIICLPNGMEQNIFRRVFDTSLLEQLQKSNTVIIGPMVWSPVFECLGPYESTNINRKKKHFFSFENNCCKVISEKEFKYFMSEHDCEFCKNHLQINFQTNAQDTPPTQRRYTCCVPIP